MIFRELNPITNMYVIFSGWGVKAMTARDGTGFYAVFSAQRSGNFLHIMGVNFLPSYTENPGEKAKKKSTGENSKNPEDPSVLKIVRRSNP